jgi:hypothetical protein
MSFQGSQVPSTALAETADALALEFAFAVVPMPSAIAQTIKSAGNASAKTRSVD